mgnify:CR=1 FL=1
MKNYISLTVAVALLLAAAVVVCGVSVKPVYEADGDIAIDGKYAITSGDATTALMVQHAAVVSSSLTIQTNTYAVTYANGVVPTFVAMYTEDPVGTNGPYATTVQSNLAIVVVEASKNYSYIVVGTRP